MYAAHLQAHKSYAVGNNDTPSIILYFPSIAQRWNVSNRQPYQYCTLLHNTNYNHHKQYVNSLSVQ